MSVAVNIISAVLKSAVGDKIGNELANEVIGISIDGVSEKGIDKINDFINGEKAKIEQALSRKNMEFMDIPEESIDYVVSEVKDLCSEIEITDEVLRQCKYDSMNLSAFLWNKYCGHKKNHMEREKDIKKGLFNVSEALIDLVRESEVFEKDVLINISNAVDDTNVGLQKISEYMKENFGKLDDNSQMALHILRTVLEQIQKMNMQRNEAKSTIVEEKKFQNNKKQKYIENWNSRLFLHVNNDENPITLADAFIMPDHEVYNCIKRIGFSRDDTLDNVIEKFVKYDRTSTMLIVGVPGMGKSSIISWIANKYSDNDDVIILRFRDWNKKDLSEGLLNAIYNALNCESRDLENKILVIDGFDEIKSLGGRKSMIQKFEDDTLDFDNFKVIITSRPNYLDIHDFKNVFTILPFNIYQIKLFYQLLKDNELEEMQIDCDNLEVLGIPVILYMAIMSDIDLTLKTTKPQLYCRIFAESGGIFDKFCFDAIGYDNGIHPLRNIENIRKYLSFLQKIAFSMFEKGDFILTKDEYKIPKLKFQEQKLQVAEFPIKPFLERDEYNIEFMHKSLYEYFVAECIFELIKEAIDCTKEKLAGILGSTLKRGKLCGEMLEFLQFKIKSSDLNTKFYIVNETFQLMLQDGMTYYTNKNYKNVIDREMEVFSNMLEIVHLWENDCLSLNNALRNYMKYKNGRKLNLVKVDFRDSDWSGTDFNNANLKRANFSYVNLIEAKFKNAELNGADLVGANLKTADFEEANLECADLECAELFGINLKKANLKGTNLIGTKLEEANLEGVDLRWTNLGHIFWATDFTDVNLEGKNLRGVELCESCLIRTNLRRADLQGANLGEAYLANTDLTEANLSNAFLKSARIIGINLTGTNLNGADFSFAHFENVNFQNSNIKDININASSWIDKELDVVLYQLLATNFTYIYVHGSNSPNEQKIYKNDLIRMKNEF